MHRTPRASALLGLLLPAVSLGAQRAPDARLRAAIQAFEAPAAVTVEFDQTLVNPLTDRTLTSHGTLARRRPDLLDVSFTAPSGDRIVSDGASLWVYLPSSAPGQVIRVAATHGAGALDPIGMLLSTPAEQYTASDAGGATIAGRATHAITITPRTRASFDHAIVWIDDATPAIRQVEITEPSGLVRRITIRSVATTAPPRSAFRFTPPSGVRVVDGRGGVQ